jgi:hypothetical protein
MDWVQIYAMWYLIVAFLATAIDMYQKEYGFYKGFFHMILVVLIYFPIYGRIFNLF